MILKTITEQNQPNDINKIPIKLMFTGTLYLDSSIDLYGTLACIFGEHIKYGDDYDLIGDIVLLPSDEMEETIIESIEKADKVYANKAFKINQINLKNIL